MSDLQSPGWPGASMLLPGPGGLEISLGLLSCPLGRRGWGDSQLDPKIAGDLEGWEQSTAARVGIWGGSRWVRGEQGQAEETPHIPRALSGICVSL